LAEDANLHGKQYTVDVDGLRIQDAEMHTLADADLKSKYTKETQIPKFLDPHISGGY